MKRIFKFVITGGPCSKKTDALATLKDALTNYGFKVFVVKDTVAEIISSGLSFDEISANDFQSLVIKKMIESEDFVKKMATDFDFGGKDVIILCDRGLLDNKVYMSYEEFAKVLAQNDYSELGIRHRYNAVFHMVTAADGASEQYHLEGFRHETPEEAFVLDKRIHVAWALHPKFVVIDNTTSFEGKIERLINGILSITGSNSQ